MSRALRPDAQAFDEVRITTVPRYKTSGLSGDEWRISAKIEFMRKGKVVHEERSRDIQMACYHVGYLHSKACDDAKGYFAGEGDACDQEGCSEPATVTYAKKKDYCERCGKPSEIVAITLNGDRKSLRRFCDRHSTRGDCGLDDCDTNYEVVEGAPSEPRPEDERQSATVIIRPDDLPPHTPGNA